MSTNALHKRRVPLGRSLFVIDVENLLGDPRASGDEALHAIGAARWAGDWAEGDHTRIAANPGLAVKFLWGLDFECRGYAQAGPDGADDALLSGLTPAFVAHRYDRLVVASGDHMFTDLVATVGALGTPTVVIAIEGSLAATLGAAADEVIELEYVAGPLPRPTRPLSSMPPTRHGRTSQPLSTAQARSAA